MFRHGDVFLQQAEIPQAAKKLPHCVLAEGELTGHCHQIREPEAAELFRHKGEMFLRVTRRKATLIHQEHADIALPKGEYRVWIQREYEPKAPRGHRRVVD